MAMNFLKKTMSWGKGDDDAPHQHNAPNEEEDKKETEAEVKQVNASPPPPGSFGSVLWGLLSSNTGRDVFTAGVSLPCWMYEPLSILQRQAEMAAHTEILTDAAKTKDSVEIMAHVAAFATSIYPGTKRFSKYPTRHS
jgi:hypothetical protein